MVGDEKLNDLPARTKFHDIEDAEDEHDGTPPDASVKLGENRRLRRRIEGPVKTGTCDEHAIDGELQSDEKPD